MDHKTTYLRNSTSIFGLQQVQLDGVLKILTSNDKVEELLLFGSRAKGNFKETSDVDIAVKGEKLTLNDLLDMSHSLDSLWLPFKIDLVNYSRIKEKDLILHIESVGKTLYKRN